MRSGAIFFYKQKNNRGLFDNKSRVFAISFRERQGALTRLSIPATFGMRSARLGIPYDLLRKTITTRTMKWLTDFQLLQNRKIPTPTANRNGMPIHQNPTLKFSNKFI